MTICYKIIQILKKSFKKKIFYFNRFIIYYYIYLLFEDFDIRSSDIESIYIFHEATDFFLFLSFDLSSNSQRRMSN